MDLPPLGVGRGYPGATLGGPRVGLGAPGVGRGYPGAALEGPEPISAQRCQNYRATIVCSAEKRVADALLGGQTPETLKNIEYEAEEETRIEIDASFIISEEERFKTLDFEQMSTAEIAAAKAMLARLTMPVSPLKSRRTAPSMQGKVYDMRATLRRSMRQGGEIRSLQFKEKKNVGQI